MRYRLVVASLLVLLGFVIYTVVTSSVTAPTSDEIPHLAAGWIGWKTGDHRLNVEHPPLVKLLAALPVLPLVSKELKPIADWGAVNEWDFGRTFLYHFGVDPQLLITRGRLSMIAIGIILCLICFTWSYRIAGPVGAFTSLCMCAFCPNILAHTRLITTDVPLAAAGALTAFLFWRLFLNPSLPLAAAAGLAMGAALTAKYSAVVLIGGIFLAGALHLMLEPRGRRNIPSALAVSLLTAFIFMALVYSNLFFPEMYLAGIRSVGVNHNPDFPFYMFGTFRKGGFPLYFPAAFLVKSSPALLLFLAAGGVVFILNRHKIFATENRSLAISWLFAAVPALAYAAFVCLFAPDIGYRYLIPCLPFLFIAGGAVAAELWKTGPGKISLVILLALQVNAAREAYPDPISYFNGIAGCSGPGAIRCLDDSNLDWGQNLIKLSEALKDESEVVILYFGSAELDWYLPRGRRMDKREILEPKNTIYAMSLHGLNRWNSLEAIPKGADWLSRFQPSWIVGNTYVIYDLRERRS